MQIYFVKSPRFAIADSLMQSSDYSRIDLCHFCERSCIALTKSASGLQLPHPLNHEGSAAELCAPSTVAQRLLPYRASAHPAVPKHT